MAAAMNYCDLFLVSANSATLPEKKRKKEKERKKEKYQLKDNDRFYLSLGTL